MKIGWCVVGMFSCSYDLDSVRRPGESPPIEWAGAVVQNIDTNATTTTFVVSANAPGDAIVVQLGCHAYPSAIGSVSVAIDAPSWTWQPLEPVRTIGSVGAAAYGAIAPDTQPATVTVTWSGATSPCSEKQSAIGYDFTVAGAHTLRFDAHHVATGSTGNCNGSVTTQADHAAVWAACNQVGKVTGVDPQYTKGADDGHGNWTSFRVTTDPAGTTEMVDMPASPALSFVLDLVTIVPQ